MQDDHKPNGATPPAPAIDPNDPPDTAPPETQPPEIEPPETAPPDTEPPIIPFAVKLHCEIPFDSDVFMPAWKTRLPNVAITIDFQASDKEKTVFDAFMRVEASNSPRATSMASGLLRRHFQTIDVLSMEADPVES